MRVPKVKQTRSKASRRSGNHDRHLHAALNPSTNPWRAALATLFVTTLVTFLSGLYFRARLQGVTGDCLGAANQLTEVGLYLTAVILLRFGFLR